MQELYIGMMSGTSVNSIDAVVVDLSTPQLQLIAIHEHPIPEAIRIETLRHMQPQANEMHTLYVLDHQFGHLFAQAALALLTQAELTAQQIRAIGSHGQTIRHYPFPPIPYTIQIGDPNIIAAQTGITTVADFRRRDIANGGQGAPLAPLFHAHLFSTTEENRAIVNIGGIANVTLLPKGIQQAQLGFDTGPGNGLLDSWIHLHLNQTYDKNGAWAAQGNVIPKLLTLLLSHPYFKQPAPKSTGRDHFHLTWLQQIIATAGYATANPVDIQSTLIELTAISITEAIQHLPLSVNRIILCGGGVHNSYLVHRIQALADPIPVHRTDEFGIPADWLEAELFAWLAQQAINQRPLDFTKITGASKPAILGGIYGG